MRQKGFKNTQILNWKSTILGQELVISILGKSGYPILLFPPSLAQFDNFAEQIPLDWFSPVLSSGKVQIFNFVWVKNNSWFDKNISPVERVRKEVNFEKALLHELIPLIQQKTGHQQIAVIGLEMGGYHAANFAFKHPDVVSHLICLGGLFNIKQFLEGHYDDDCYFNNPVDYLPNLNDPWYLDRIRKMNIVLSVADSHQHYLENIHLSGILNDKSVNHWLDIYHADTESEGWWTHPLLNYLSRLFGEKQPQNFP